MPPTWGHKQLAQLGAPHLVLLKTLVFLIKAPEHGALAGLGCEDPQGSFPLTVCSEQCQHMIPVSGLPSKWVRRRPLQCGDELEPAS